MRSPRPPAVIVRLRLKMMKACDRESNPSKTTPGATTPRPGALAPVEYKHSDFCKILHTRAAMTAPPREGPILGHSDRARSPTGIPCTQARRPRRSGRLAVRGVCRSTLTRRRSRPSPSYPRTGNEARPARARAVQQGPANSNARWWGGGGGLVLVAFAAAQRQRKALE